MTERDALLISYLVTHKGMSKVVSSRKICEYLNSNGVPTKVDNIHNLVRELILEYRLPICQLNRKGYYWSTCDAELKQAIADFKSRITEINKRIKILESHMIGD